LSVDGFVDSLGESAERTMHRITCVSSARLAALNSRDSEVDTTASIPDGTFSTVDEERMQSITSVREVMRPVIDLDGAGACRAWAAVASTDHRERPGRVTGDLPCANKSHDERAVLV